MGLKCLQHFLIQTSDLRGTADWYVDVLGMREGPHPDFKFPVVWLYVGEEDVLHLTEGGANVSDNRMQYLGQQSEAVSGTGVVDHVAFRADGLKDMLDRLRARKVEFTTRKVDEHGLFQIFLFDPNGVKIELNFAGDEANEIAPEMLASELAG